MKKVEAFQNKHGFIYATEEEAKKAELRTDLLETLSKRFEMDPNGVRFENFLIANIEAIARALQGWPV